MSEERVHMMQLSSINKDLTNATASLWFLSPEQLEEERAYFTKKYGAPKSAMNDDLRDIADGYEETTFVL